MSGVQQGRPQGTVLVVDLDGRRIASAPDPGLDDFTERHHCDLLAGTTLEPSSNIEETLRTHSGGHIAFISPTGVPNRAILKRAAASMSGGRRIYLYWPAERAVEVLDRHRVTSIRNVQIARKLHHVGLVMDARARSVLAPLFGAEGMLRRPGAQIRRARSLFFIVRKRAKSRVKLYLVMRRFADEHRQWMAKPAASTQPAAAAARLRQAAARILGEERVRTGRMPSAADTIAGAGAYARLDYWVSIRSGGSYGHTCFLAKAAANVTHSFRCIFANRYELLDQLGVTQHIIPHSFSHETTADLIVSGDRLKEPVARLLDQQKPAYVYERIVLGSSAAAAWCADRDVPYIVEYNGSELAMGRSFGNPYKHETELEAIEDFNFSVASMINVISEPVAESLIERGIPREKILVNPNAVNPDIYKPLDPAARAHQRGRHGFSDSDIVVGFSGTFGGWHGIEVLAEAMPRICRLDPNIRFLLIGDGNLKPLIRDAVAKSGIADQVVDLGLVPQMEGALALGACDILVAPHAQKIDGKTFFGSPTKLFEYLAVGATVVSSDLAQLGEVMRPALSVAELAADKPVDTARGVLVEPGSVDQLVAAVDGLVKRPAIRAALGRNARAAAIANYTWDIHVENIWRFMAGQPLKGYMMERAAKA